jgi:integrase
MLDAAIIDLWAAERKVSPKGKDTHRAVAKWFYDRTGRKSVAEITRKDVLAFKLALVTEGQTPANIKMKLSRLRTLLQWAADNDHAESNVATGITIKDTDAAKNKRKEFDLASLNAIFSSPVFAEGVRPAGGKGEAAYWLPLLALFTGARLEELGQLTPNDVSEHAFSDGEGVQRSAWFIRIREDETASQTLKNAASERLVPVHITLEKLGFLAFIADAKDAKQQRLFPKLAANVYGRLTAKWGEWFSVYKRTICGITDKRMVFHSFRHTFKQYARHASIVEGVQRQIMGHAAGDVADSYGSGHTLHQLVRGMAAYKVPGLALPVVGWQP